MSRRADPLIVLAVLLAAATALALKGEPAPGGGPATPDLRRPPVLEQPPRQLPALRDPEAPAPVTPATAAGGADTALALSHAFRQAARRLRPSVLHITTERWAPSDRDDSLQNLLERFLGGPEGADGAAGPRGRTERSEGTGFVLREDGIAVTNDHVVADAERVVVRLTDGTEVVARVVGTDPLSDLAVLRLGARPDGQPWTAVELGDSDALDVGDWVLAVGNPFGLDQTVTAGIVSAKGRSRVGIAAYEDFIQTDTAINPGNSGGPLAGLDGRVVGVTTAIATRSGANQGVGFAIPSGMAREVVADILEHGHVVRGWLGVSIQDASPELSARLGLGARGGALVTAVVPGSPADTGGLRLADLILSVGGRPVDETTRLRHLVARAAIGQPLVLHIVRDGVEQDVTLVTIERPRPAGERPSATPAAPRRGVGIAARVLTPELAQAFGFDAKAPAGVVIVSVEPGSLAFEHGIRPGLILQEVDRKPIRDLDALEAATASIDLAQGVLLRVWDGEASTFVLLRAP